MGATGYTTFYPPKFKLVAKCHDCYNREAVLLERGFIEGDFSEKLTYGSDAVVFVNATKTILYKREDAVAFAAGLSLGLLVKLSENNKNFVLGYIDEDVRVFENHIHIKMNILEAMGDLRDDDNVTLQIQQGD